LYNYCIFINVFSDVFLMFHFLKSITSLLRGKSYYGDFIKTLIIGFMCYIIGFVIVVLQIIVSMSMSMDVDGIAMFYYLILMPIVLLPIMVVYFIFLLIIRFFFQSY
jgi:hypothetical protein